MAQSSERGVLVFMEPLARDRSVTGRRSRSVDRTAARQLELPVHPKRVLVVDDEVAIAEFLRECIGQNYLVEIATNGVDALDAASRARPDLVLLDMHMPGSSGIDVLEQLKTRDDSIPVIVVTGTPHNAVVARALELGAFAYLPKPFNVRYVQHLVAAALSRRP